MLALLTHRKTGKKLLAASTHLFWNPAFPDIKLAQAALLCKMVRNIHHNMSLVKATPVSPLKSHKIPALCTCQGYSNLHVHHARSPASSQIPPEKPAEQITVDQTSRGACCAQIADFLRDHSADPDTPVILGGDFNSLWGKWESDPFDQVCALPGSAAPPAAMLRNEVGCALHSATAWKASHFCTLVRRCLQEDALRVECISC